MYDIIPKYMKCEYLTFRYFIYPISYLGNDLYFLHKVNIDQSRIIYKMLYPLEFLDYSTI
jgi:hypothetical protein